MQFNEGGEPAAVAPLQSDPQLRAEVARCRDLSPGPALVLALLGLDASRLNAADRVEVMVAWQRLTHWLAAQFHLSVAAAAGPLSRSADTANGDAYSLTGDEVDDIVCAEIGAALRLSPQAAARVVERARAAAGHLAPIAERMLAGDLGEAHLARAVTLCADAPPEVAHAAAADVAAKAPRCTPTQLRGRLLRALVKRDPNAIQRRVRAAKRDRGVTLWSDPDLRGRLDVHGEWMGMNRAHRHLTDWAHARKQALRDLRRVHPNARLCCPQAITESLEAAAVLAISPPGGPTPGGPAPGGPAPGGPAAQGTQSGRVGLTSVQARAILDADPSLGCRWCDAVHDRALPTVDQLRADALVEACELLAEQMAAEASGSYSPGAGARGNGTRGSSEGGGSTSSGAAGGAAGSAAVSDDDRVLPPPTGRRRRWSHAVVVVDLRTALGLADEPGWVPGYGHVPAPIARELAAGATHWQRFLLDEDHKLLSTGRFTYRPSERLRDLVTARDHTCTFPGCGRPAGEADLDHRTNYNGTNTTADNLHPLCRTHHRLKTHAGWTVQRTPDGQDTWTSPLGHTYTQQSHTPWLPEQDLPADP